MATTARRTPRCSEFLQNLEYYDRIKTPPKWESKIITDPGLMMAKVQEFTNQRITNYLNSVRQTSAQKKKKAAEVAAQTVAYKLEGRNVVRLPMVNVWQDLKCNAKKYILGPHLETDPQKTILVIGTKDSRKNTLIDCFLNYILAPNWDENFTLRITDGSAKTGEMHAFTIPSTYMTQLPYGVNIVNTPGFSGDKHDPRYDKDCLEKIKRFFGCFPSHGIDTISAIWLVHNRESKTVSPTYNYLCDALEKLMGCPIAGKVVNVIVCAKSKTESPVLQAIRNSNLPNKTVYPVLTVGRDLHRCWFDTMRTMNDLAELMEKENPTSICLSPESVEKRHIATEGLRQMTLLVRTNCQKLVTVEQEQNLVRNQCKGKKIIDPSVNFEYEIWQAMKVRRELPYCGIEVTNCSICFMTCHEQCAIERDEAKYDCVAMKDGFCTVCPKHCSWDLHFNRAFQVFLRVEKKKKVFADLLKEYGMTSKHTLNDLNKAMDTTSVSTRASVEGLIEKATDNLSKIRKMSGNMSGAKRVDTIDLIILEEMRDTVPQWKKRIEVLKQLKERGQLGLRIKGKKETEKML